MLRRSVNRLDHIAILVKLENLETYKQLLTDTLGVAWDEAVPNESAGVIALPSWDSGLELIAPLRPSGTIHDRIERFGEGTVSIVFGVADLEKGVERAVAGGGQFIFNLVLAGDEPWLKRFETFKEAKVKIFPDHFSSTVTLGEIVPAAHEMAEPA
jgi:hypothetical protein